MQTETNSISLLISNLLIQTILIAITFFLGKYQTSYNNKRISYQQRYEKLYFPVLELIIQKHLPFEELDVFDDNFKSNVFEIVSKNTIYLGVDSLYRFRFLLAKDHSRYNHYFKKFISTFLKESHSIEKFLRYPKKSKYYLETLGILDF